ncbi:hypothetical protein [Kitasatospora sp. LaBMicrA B282]|uniref:hypothetical protein n=1 Tax=Kitasatospora sp. LaBMicrA B282 TaxID=3420949 RepID=UPI003D106D99
MKLTKRTGAALLAAVGASAVVGQGVASAATPMTPSQVAAVEDALAKKSVPMAIPLETVSQAAPMLGLGGAVQGSVPASPVLPPVPAERGPHDVVADKVVQPLNFSTVGPRLDTGLALPGTDGLQPGNLNLAAADDQLRAFGPAVGLGHPVQMVEGADGKLTDGSLASGDLDPRLIPAAVSAVPGAKAELGGPRQDASLVQQVQDLLTTTSAAAAEAPGLLPQG